MRWRYLAASLLAAAACARHRATGQTALTADEMKAQGCIPVSERAGREFGCFIMATETVGQFRGSPVFWHIYEYADREAANAARGPRSTVIESLGRIWLLSIEPATWHPSTGDRAAIVGPLPIDTTTTYTAQYMEAVFRPGMKSAVHRHSGPEAWYTVTGQTCLETPDSMFMGRAGGEHVIVPHGPPMELTATGTETRRALVLILFDSAQPPSSVATDWTPKGRCSRFVGQ